MAQKKNGTVGTGDQNRWLSTGKIYEKIPEGIPFKKTDPAISGGWTNSACWIAGTPVTWIDDISEVAATTKEAEGITMLFSEEDGEFHPLITFFNKVMEQLIKDGKLDLLKKLDNESNAAELWGYLEDKYLKPSEIPETQH